MKTRLALPALCIGMFVGTLCAAGAAHSAKPPNKPGKPGSGDDTGCSYPSFADSPKNKLSGDEADFNLRYGGAVTTIKDHVDSKNFRVDGSVTLGNWVLDGVDGTWFVEDMADDQHRVGNQGIDADGAVCTACTPRGKRLSAWYDGLSDPEVGSLLSEELVEGSARLALGGKEVSDQDDPTRVGTAWASSRLYTTWLSTFQRNPGGFGSAKDGSLSFGPGTYIETRVSFEQMQTPGFRLSMWLMPVEKQGMGDEGAVPSIAYDNNYANGFEMDIFEFEPIDRLADGTVCGNLIEFAWIRGFHSGKGKSPAGLDGKNHFEGDEEGYCSDGACSTTFGHPDGDLRPDINEGWNTIGLLWTDSAIAWSFNGELVLEITEAGMIPSRDHYLIVSREMTNGLGQGQFSTNADGTVWTQYLPAETGLYGWNGNSNVGEHTDGILQDKALIDYIQAWGNVTTYPSAP